MSGLQAMAVALLILIAGLVPTGSASDIATPAAKAKQSQEYSPYTAWELGYSGKGVSICIMDTGTDDSHPSLAGKWLGGVDVSKPDTPLTPRDGSFNADDTNGHGTTCAGIAMGTGAPDKKYQGTAPDARLVELRIGTIFGAAPGEGPSPVKLYDATLLGEKWALAHQDDKWSSGGGQYQGIDVLSLSWGIDVGGSADGSDPYSAGLDRLVDAGVIVVVAAGNDGPSNDGFTGLGSASNVITVGATDDRDTIERADDIIASYSSRGPRKDNGDDDPYNELKPDVSAPGTGITQAEFDRVGDGSGNGYGSRGSGTSYATPLVAGVVALMLEANRDLTPAIAKEVLRASAERRENATFYELDPFWNKDFGWGMVDAYEACRIVERITDMNAIDVGLQSFVDNLTSDGQGAVNVRLLAWNRYGDMDRVELRVDNGSWVKARPLSAQYCWTCQLQGISPGNHTIYTRSLAGNMSSLVTSFQFNVTSGGQPKAGIPGAVWGWAGGAATVVAGAASYIYLRKRQRAGKPAET
jgi:hypothetical protein